MDAFNQRRCCSRVCDSATCASTVGSQGTQRERWCYGSQNDARIAMIPAQFRRSEHACRCWLGVRHFRHAARTQKTPTASFSRRLQCHLAMPDQTPGPGLSSAQPTAENLAAKVPGPVCRAQRHRHVPRSKLLDGYSIVAALSEHGDRCGLTL